MTLQTE